HLRLGQLSQGGSSIISVVYIYFEGRLSLQIKVLRAGVPITIIAQIRSRLRIVGTVGLHAISDGIVALRRDDHDSAVIVVLVIVVARRIIARPAIVTLRRDRAADQRTGDRAGNEAATTTAATAMLAA